MTEHVDIAIIGGGIVGASIAHALNGRRTVRVLEQESALGYHSTGRSAAEYTYRFHSSLVGRLTAASKEFMFSPPDGFSDVPLLKPRGNLIIASKEKAEKLASVLASELANPPELDVSEVYALSVEEAISKVPFLDPKYVAAAFYDPDCWDVEVESLLQGYARSARAQGVQFCRETQLLSAQSEDKHWRLMTNKGEFTATTVVNAAGAWADPIATLFGTPTLGISPLRRTAITIKTPGYDLTHMPEVNEVDEDFYFKPDAGHLMVSPADETPVDPHDAWPEEMDIAVAADFMCQCTTLEIEHVAHSWAGLRSFASDRIPVIGFSAQQPNFFWAAGLGGFGIQTSACIGQMAAALLCNEAQAESPIGLSELAKAMSPTRFMG